MIIDWRTTHSVQQLTTMAKNGAADDYTAGADPGGRGWGTGPLNPIKSDEKHVSHACTVHCSTELSRFLTIK